MRKALLLTIWLLGILFPAACLGRYSTVYQWAFRYFFGPEWMHVFMHLLVYAGLCLLLLAVMPRSARPAPFTWRSALWLTGIVLAVGVAQESLQWLSQGILPWQGEALSASLYDLGVDLSGALLGGGMVHLWRVYHPL